MTAEEMKHLEFIQGVITRLGNNSFQLKNWALTTNAAIFTIGHQLEIPWVIVLTILLFLTLAFYFLSIYYLRLERKTRALYNGVVRVYKGDNEEIKKAILFTMPLDKFKADNCHIISVMSSPAIWGLYLPILSVYAIFLLPLFFCTICEHIGCK